MVKRLISFVMVCVLATGGIFFAPAVARAQISEFDYIAAAVLLSKYRLVQGDERGLRLSDGITRAEMAKISVLALGKESQVPTFAGRMEYPDTASHWADAYISMARQSGVMRGYPDGTFKPNAEVSYAEVVTVLSRLVGLNASMFPWPHTYIVSAREAGIIPDNMTLISNPQGAAIRGDVFVLLQRTVLNVKDQAGQSLAQRYLDHSPPIIIIDPQPAETDATQVIVSGTISDFVSAKLNGQDLPLSAGYFQQTVSLRLGPNTIRVQAWDDAGNPAEATVIVNRSRGTATAIQFTGPTSVIAGQAAQYQVTIRDRFGEEITSRVDVLATVTGDIGTFDLATNRFTASPVAGQGAISIVAGTVQASVNVSVTAGALDRIVISPAEITLAPGETMNFSATGRDVLGNVVPLPSLSWSASGGAITTAGLFTAPVSPGTFTVSASAGGKTGSATVLPLNHKVATVTLSAPTGQLRANGKSEMTLTATLRDSANAIVTDYKGPVTVTTSNSGMISAVEASVSVLNGVASIKIRAGSSAGTGTITVSTNLGKTASVNVIVNPQSVQSIRITGAPIPSTDGTTQGVITIQALDEDGNPLLRALSQNMLVRLTVTPTGAATFLINNTVDRADVPLGAIDPTTGDVRTRTTVRYNPASGTLYITATIMPASLAYVRVLPGTLVAGPVGTPAQVRIEPVPDTFAGETRAIFVNVVDNEGFRVLTGTALTDVSLRDQTGATWPANATAEGGRFRFDVMQVKAGSYTYTASLMPGGHTFNLTTPVVPNALATVTLTATPDSIQANNSSTTVLKAELKDAYGNLITSGSYPVTFTKTTSTGATQPFATRVVNSTGGVAQVTVTAASVIGPESYTVSVPNTTPPNANPPNPPFTASTTITTVGFAQRLVLSYGDNNGDSALVEATDSSGTAGIAHTVFVDVQDQFGNLLTSDNGRTISLTYRNLSSSAEMAPISAATVNGRATFIVTRNLAGWFAIKAESGSLIKALTTGYGGLVSDFEVRPGHTTTLRVHADLNPLRADSGKSFARVSVQMMDENQNVTTNQTGQPLTVTLNSSSATFETGFFTINDTLPGLRTNTRTVVIPQGSSVSPTIIFYSGTTAGSISLTATTVDGGNHSTPITVTTGGPIAKVDVAAILPVTLQPFTYADAVVTGQTVEVTARDSNGARVTDYGANNETLSITTQGDAVVVAYFDRDLQTWRSLDQPFGDGIGIYPTTHSVPADRGRALFRVRANTPGIKVYQVGYGAVPSALTVTGQFNGAAPEYLTVQVSRRTVTGGGDQVAVEARVRDAFGNVLPHVTGPIQFSVLGPANTGALLSAQAELINGVATVFYQSNLIVPDNATVEVHAWSTGLRRSDNTPLVVGSSALSPAIDTFNVDGTPSVIGLTFVSGGALAVASSGDVITYLFSEAINGATVVTGLVPNGGVITGLGDYEVKFESATATISFPNLPGLGTINLVAGAITNDNRHSIASISMNAVGSAIHITLGAKKTSTNPDTIVTSPGSGGAVIAMNGAIRDTAGSGAFGPFNVTPTGNF